MDTISNIISSINDVLKSRGLADERGYYNHTFSLSSRPDENCHRGWQFIIKK